MQPFPDTAARYGVIAGDSSAAPHKAAGSRVNLRAGTHYLHDLIVLPADDVSLALAA